MHLTFKRLIYWLNLLFILTLLGGLLPSASWASAATITHNLLGEPQPLDHNDIAPAVDEVANKEAVKSPKITAPLSLSPVPTLSSQQVAKLVASVGAVGDLFGRSVAISGNTVVVGADMNDYGGLPDSGAAYVFVDEGSSWTQQATLIPGDGAEDDRFGFSVAVSGDTAVVGVWQDDDQGDRSGSAYVFVRSGSTWTQQAKLTASDMEWGSDGFGWSVALSQDTLIVGSPYHLHGNFYSGSAYIFARSGSTWTQQAELVAGDSADWDYFGGTVALSEDTALVGASGDDDNGSGSGSAYVFVRSGSSWVQQAKLTASDGASGDDFGEGIAVSGDTAIIGAALADTASGNNSGSAYVFGRNGSSWTEETILAPSGADDEFGWSVAMAGNKAIIGAPFDASGSAYVFEIEAEQPYLTLDVLDFYHQPPDGNPVSQLTLDEEGWPTPNPLTVQMTLSCPADGPSCASPLNLNLDSDNGLARFYVYEATLNPTELDPTGTLCNGNVPDDPLLTSYTTYTLDCDQAFFTLSPGSSVDYIWQVWVQPSDLANLEFTASWGGDTTTQVVQVTQAAIHPVFFVHGILGSMPPGESVIIEWPQQLGSPNLSTGSHLDPFIGSYKPLIDNLLKMGYEIDKTLFPLTYDWRKSNLHSAAYLSEQLEIKVGKPNDSKIPPELSYVNHDGKADVIVHSMSGMVLRSYIQDMATTGDPPNTTAQSSLNLQPLDFNPCQFWAKR